MEFFRLVSKHYGLKDKNEWQQKNLHFKSRWSLFGLNQKEVAVKFCIVANSGKKNVACCKWILGSGGQSCN